MSASEHNHDRSNDKGEPTQRFVAFRQDPEEISLVRLASVFLRNRRSLVLLPLVVAVLIVGVSLVQPRTYTSGASFMPQAGSSQMSNLAGIASQFGFNLPTGDIGGSPAFYAELLGSRQLLKEVVETEYEFPTGEAGQGELLRGDLVELLDVEGDTRGERVENAVEEFRDEMSVNTGVETGLVEVAVTTRWPALSRSVTERLVELVNRFNLETRQTQAAAERRFTENRLAQARGELEAAEDSLQLFLQRNRRWQNSPDLRFEHDRLQRRVMLRQQVVSALSESYEQARIDEVRNTPVITVVENADMPARPDSRNLVLKGVLGLLLGGILALFWAFGREFATSAREREPEEYLEFEELRRATYEDLSRVWRRVRRTVGRGAE